MWLLFNPYNCKVVALLEHWVVSTLNIKLLIIIHRAPWEWCEILRVDSRVGVFVYHFLRWKGLLILISLAYWMLSCWNLKVLLLSWYWFSDAVLQVKV
jgi:hypothetical protein